LRGASFPRLGDGLLHLLDVFELLRCLGQFDVGAALCPRLRILDARRIPALRPDLELFQRFRIGRVFETLDDLGDLKIAELSVTGQLVQRLLELGILVAVRVLDRRNQFGERNAEVIEAELILDLDGRRRIERRDRLLDGLAISIGGAIIVPVLQKTTGSLSPHA